ncbi:MAG: class I SAM-dependent methyltransferase [Gammaproteobacteria bacterium]|nr:class I SAM-dependent methyltransferase [Gammaproteobacteria bacterium]
MNQAAPGAAPVYTVESACRACGGSDLHPVLSFGDTPIADRLLENSDLSLSEPMVPLTLVFCPACGLLQIVETVDPQTLFGDAYPYFSSTSVSWLRQCRDNALELIRILGLDRDSRVVEIASNDGYMLRNFRDAGIPVLGFEPADPPARAALDDGIPTRREFFTEETAAQLAAESETADLVLANNVVAHVDDLHDFLRGVKRILNDGGMFVLEVAYAGDLIERRAFDTIYHQHLCYFTLTPLERLLAGHGFHVRDVRRLPSQGGSIRVYAGLTPGSASANVRAMLEQERRSGILEEECLEAFACRIAELRTELVDLLNEMKARGGRIAAYGAAGKATTLLHYCGIGASLVEYIVDLNPYKHGKYMPGCRLVIQPPDRLREDRPDYLLLLAWNLRDEILAQQQDYLAAGGRIITPIPRPEIVAGTPSPDTGGVNY